MNNILQPECRPVSAIDSSVKEWQNPNYVKNLAFLDIVQITSIDVVRDDKSKTLQ